MLSFDPCQENPPSLLKPPSSVVVAAQRACRRQDQKQLDCVQCWRGGGALDSEPADAVRRERACGPHGHEPETSRVCATATTQGVKRSRWNRRRGPRKAAIDVPGSTSSNKASRRAERHASDKVIQMIKRCGATIAHNVVHVRCTTPSLAPSKVSPYRPLRRDRTRMAAKRIKSGGVRRPFWLRFLAAQNLR